jgi:hypothetical protein
MPPRRFDRDFFMVRSEAPVVEVLTLETGCRIVDHTSRGQQQASSKPAALIREPLPSMRKSALPVSIAALSLLCSCQGVVLWGNLAVLAVSVGIFLGTLALGRS